jgi:hypothetical protein
MIGIVAVACLAALAAGGPDCSDQVDSRSKQLSDEAGELIELAVGVPPLNDEVPPLDVTERTKLLLGRPKRIDAHRRSAAEKTDAVDCPRLLRPDGERRGEEAAG